MKQPLKRGGSLDSLPTAGLVERMIPKSSTTDKTKPVKQTVFIPRKVHQRLLEICLARNTKQQQIFMAALNNWLIAEGEPGIDELEAS